MPDEGRQIVQYSADELMQMRTTIVGTAFRGPEAVAALARLQKGSVLKLRREPDNPHDANATAIYSDAQHLGYVPRMHNPELAKILDCEPDSLKAEITLEAIVERGQIKFPPKILISDKE